MTPFLQQVTRDLLQQYGNDLSQITIVFPNRRARLFFNEYLCASSDKPVWAPAYASLDELFQQTSDLQIADSLKLLTELYYTYTDVYYANKEKAAVESFDEFYFFGEILLGDFNDVDKNMVNELALFSNLLELDNLKDNFEHLDEEQWGVIERFFKDISTNRTQLKEAFFSIWSILGTVYRNFKEKLRGEGIAYDGMAFRAAIENMQANGVECFTQEKYIFVGFNVLTECEKLLFKILKQNDKALFYWDYDDYYMADTQEAGRFMRDNIHRFGNELKGMQTDLFTAKPKKICLVASPSESAQAGYIPKWIGELNYPQGFEQPDSAIVLCNEQNLQSVMHAIPSEVGNVNITMGFPLSQTPVFSLLTVLAELQLKGVDEAQGRFRYNYVLPVLRHPYIRLLFPEAGAVQQTMIRENNFFPTAEDLQNPQLFRATKDAVELSEYLLETLKAVAVVYGKQSETEGDENNSFNDLYSEALFRAFQALNRLHDLITTKQLQVQKPTFVSLLKQLLSGTSIPFHGEPARGLQVMGVLETRNMDFRNVLMMSTNEGMMPKSDNDSSFIPHFIRKFFGMTTIEHQDSLYAYYFYRLLQRAENIVLMYNTANQQTGKSEMSRFLLQLLTEYPYPIERISLQSEIQPHNPMPLRVEKSEALLEKIKHQFDIRLNDEAQRLSASAINNFFDCSLRFYLHYVEDIRPPQELSDELDNSVLGSVFHKTAELIYREIGHVQQSEGEPFPAFVVTQEQIEGFLKADARIEKAIEKAFNEEFFNREMPRERYNGEQLIYFRIVKQFIKRLLRMDKAEAPFTMLGLEQRKYRTVTMPDGVQLQLGGIVDRMDYKDGHLRVVDYKTGGNPKEANEMGKLFDSNKERANYIFQAFLYASILVQEQPDAVQPALVYIQKAMDDDYSPIINWDKQPINDFRDLAEEFETALLQKLGELFDPSIPFEQTTNEKACEWCDFKGMCGR
ncbi:MAG: PD-(D/E)XK nuclease family protein [Paludibacteraceae bacterium]|nr:PD-(D/E)XK nuclease family protein [Paludibacteraceae bacterium]